MTFSQRLLRRLLRSSFVLVVAVVVSPSEDDEVFERADRGLVKKDDLPLKCLDLVVLVSPVVKKSSGL